MFGVGPMLKIIAEQYPVEPLVWKPLRISFAEGIAMLREEGLEVRTLMQAVFDPRHAFLMS